MFSKFGLDLASWSKVIVLGEEQTDDDTQKDFCARGRILHGWVCCRRLRSARVQFIELN